MSRNTRNSQRVSMEEGKGNGKPPKGNGSVKLYNAIRKGDALEVRRILRQMLNPDVLLKESTCLTGLIFATVNRHFKIVHVFLRYDASVDLKDHKGLTAAMYACIYKQTNILKALKEAGANLELFDNEGKTVLHHAAQTGALECIEFLMDDQGLNINKADNEGKTAVMYAISGDRTDCLERMVCYKTINLNIADKIGNSPLIYAIHLRKQEHATILLDNHAEVNIVNNQGKTALSKAFEQTINPEMLELVKRLLEHGARPDVSPDDEICLHEMIARGEKKIVQLMLRNGCSPRMRLCKRNIFKFHFPEELSPLAVALLSNQRGIAKFLLANMFLTHYDVTRLPMSREIMLHLLNKSFNHCLSLQKALSFNPLPLFVLSALSVSNLVYNKDYKYKTLSQRAILSKLPTVLQQKIQFRSELAMLCVEEWETMPLMIEAGYDFPVPRPLSAAWPIGHKLIQCQLLCCANSTLAGYRIVKKKTMDDEEDDDLF